MYIVSQHYTIIQVLKRKKKKKKKEKKENT